MSDSQGTAQTRAKPCGTTVEWDDGQDIAPHELYELSVPAGGV